MAKDEQRVEQAFAAPLRRRKTKPAKGTPMTNPPLTPLIDVFLFLIIFFLLSCQFHQLEGTIPANLPSTLSGPGEAVGIKLDPISIKLRPGGEDSVFIEIGETGRKADDMPALLEFLQSAKARYGQAESEKLPIIIKPVQGVRWGFVVDAFNQAVRAGFKEVGVAPSTAQ